MVCTELCVIAMILQVVSMEQGFNTVAILGGNKAYNMAANYVQTNTPPPRSVYTSVHSLHTDMM